MVNTQHKVFVALLGLLLALAWTVLPVSASPPVQEHYRRAVELATADGDKMGQAIAEAGLGRAHHGCGNAGEALTHLRASLSLYEELGETEQVEQVSDLIAKVQGE